MTLTAIGGLMLVVVLMIYMKMVNKRLSARQHKSQVQHLIEKAEIFEGAGTDAAALKVIDEALEEYPNNPRLIQKRDALRGKLENLK